MRKRFTVPTDCRYIDARVAESVTTAPYIAAADRIIAPAPSSRTRSFHDLHPKHRDDGSMGPSTDISRSRTVPNNVGNTGSVLRHWSASARGVAVTGISI
jgi:hypothetical protein